MPQELLKGLEHFRNTDLERYKSLYRRLADEGQRPNVLFIACSDSRIVPNLLTGTGPGDLFIVRTIGNIVSPAGTTPPDPTAAAVEFSVTQLGVREVVVCGHSLCGAMTALYDPPEGLGELAHLSGWVEHARPAMLPEDKAAGLNPDERLRLTVQRNVLLSMDRLAALPLVKQRRASGELLLHGWYYDIASTEVTVLDPSSGEFRPAERLLED